jgi:predicted ATPase
MRVTHLRLTNWRNFKNVDIDIPQRLFVFGPNASGKSNLLDALRFLRDLTLDGGGFQQAVRDRGGMRRLRNLAARNNDKSRVTIAVALGDDDKPQQWEYELTFTSEPSGHRRPIVVREVVRSNGKIVVDRSQSDEHDDKELFTQTSLEQVVANRDFRDIADFFSGTSYLHLVPQVIRDPERSGSRLEDPFGGDFIARVARAGERDRNRRLKFINSVLQTAVPQLASLELVRDIEGHPHLEARFKHWRKAGAKQDETDFSDGTIRLIGLLWMLLDRSKASAPILLEEPELSLHDEIVRQLPTFIKRAALASSRQIIATSHASAILDDEGLGLDEVVVLTPSEEGTSAALARDIDGVADLIESGLTIHEALNPMLRPIGIDQLSLFSLA